MKSPMNPPNEALSKAQEQIPPVDNDGRIVRSGDVTNAWNSYCQGLDKRIARTNQPAKIGIASGLAPLDKALGGHRGITIVAGGPATGKTSLVTQTAVTSLFKDPKLAVIYLSYEASSTSELFNYIVCMVAAVDHSQLYGGLTAQEHQRIHEAKSIIRKTILPRLSVLTLEDPLFNNNYVDIWARILRGVKDGIMQSGTCSRLLIVLDRLQKMPLPRIQSATDKSTARLIRQAELNPDAWRMNQISEMYRELWKSKTLAAFLVVSELRKEGTSRKRPGPEDILGSVSLTYEPDRVLLLNRTAVNDSEGVTDVSLRTVKARRGEEIELPLTFRYRQYRFEEFEPLMPLPTTTMQTKSPAQTKGRKANRPDPFSSS